MATLVSEPETASKLQVFLQWLQANGADLRGCTIRPCGPDKGYGVFSTSPCSPENGVVMAVPLDLAITPMRVLQDPILGPTCRAMFEQGGVDDRFLVMLFLLVESVRPDSLWKPYLDILPRKFNSPLWFTDGELSELKGTALYRASILQRKSLEELYEKKVKGLVEELLQSHQQERTRDIHYEDFLWANSVFWTRALNIPMPHSYVFPKSEEEHDTEASQHEQNSDHKDSDCMECNCGESGNGEPVWVEGLVPGIDFCNHGTITGSKAVATWEVDSAGTASGIPNSMYLLLAADYDCSDKEIHISYGNKGNEELLYLYGFVIEENPDDYLMVHYPVEALEHVTSIDKKTKLLEIQSAEMRCLLPKTLLDIGFFSTCQKDNGTSTSYASEITNYSWSGERKAPSYLNRLVFPEEFMVTLRTISMKDFQIDQVSSMFGEVLEPSDKEVQAAIWEVCGDLGAFELLVDLLSSKLIGLEEGSGTEGSDTELLEKLNSVPESEKEMRRHYWSSVVYRRGQKHLTKLFLREAQHALELCAQEQN
ncbi:Histone-lysine N-methyltransferase setd3 [Rhynchospora pubera]|uniref:Histone-lysine N-methyltransferase setd3 n=1 Tax=Rhynchospora pubera TaxID=906938 RepID=A0AAV8GU90_9POAL|nr:Histone-lysine N-methyltransferase setd3 [Rhynchospora pubera]